MKATQMKAAQRAARKQPRIAATDEPTSPDANPDQRLQMIAAAAYFRSERRGFAPGREMEDWLAAEAEVDGAAAAKMH